MFETGKQYKNHKGIFTVLEVGDKIKVKYEATGETASLVPDIAEKLSCLVGIAERHNISKSELDRSYFKMLGYLATHASIGVLMPPKAKARFIAEYENLTGMTPEGKGFCVQGDDTIDKRDVSIHVALKPVDGIPFEAFGLNSLPQKSKKVVIYNTEFGFKLFKYGFILGTKQMVENILSFIPIEYHQDFQEGCKN